ncbi:MAG TPA: cysteine--tRNA ligase [Thermohalobaculum sp.]|nr:cysteine--tRNA ligase [Thermohalobaculum sp.]
MTDIQLYNTRTRTKEPFKPLREGDVRMYVCGPTVYDRAHIGNARPVVVFDVLFRLLRHVYGEGAVTYVRNFTDVDDKINARAAATGRSIREITDETVGWYHEDMDALGALRPSHEPRATEHIGDMVAMIEALIASGHAYAAEGHVLFDVGSYPDYGKLARRSLDDMVAGARVEVAPYKKNPMDFVLWKPSSDDLPGWDSPWGRGRPGWHIECSAMSKALLGDTFDIHGGGIDLQFPHHENEVAQSCCANHTKIMAQVWMHTGFLQVEGEKMAKSLGNFFTVKDLLDKGIPGEVIRFVLLSTHYRTPLDWTERKVEEAGVVLDRWRRALDRVEASYLRHEADGTRQSEAVMRGLVDDLNTWNGIRGVDVMAKRVLDAPDDPKVFMDAGVKFLNGLTLLGFENLASKSAEEFEQWYLDASQHRGRVEDLIKEREQARRTRDFLRADGIRDGLIAAGVEVKDTRDGVDWKFTRDFNAAKLEAL